MRLLICIVLASVCAIYACGKDNPSGPSSRSLGKCQVGMKVQPGEIVITLPVKLRSRFQSGPMEDRAEKAIRVIRIRI